MKILIFYEQFSWGGVDKYLVELINNWPNNKDELIIVTNENNVGFNKIKKTFKRKSIKYFFFNSYSYTFICNIFNNNKLSFFIYFLYIFQPILLILTTIKFIFFLKGHKKINNIFSVNGAYPASWANISIIFAAKILKIKKRVMGVHHEASSPSLIIKPYHYFIDKMLSKSLTDLVCVSKATLKTIKKSRYLNHKNFKNKVIHNDLKLSPQDLKKKLFIKLKSKYFLLGILGRVESYKGHEDVLYAISQLQSRYRNKIKLLIIGAYEPKNYKYLMNLSEKLKVQDSIIFTGYLSCNSHTIINSLDAVIMATRDFEGFGYTALEAVKIGKPLITTNLEAIKEFINPDFVQMVNPGDRNNISEKIKSLLKNTEIHKKTSNKYKKILKKEFQMSKDYRSIFI